MAHSSPAGIWEIHLCRTCFYSWRTTEPVSATDPEHYDERFRLTPEQIARFAEFPVVPPLKRKGGA
jgi:hypothetical protein